MNLQKNSVSSYFKMIKDKLSNIFVFSNAAFDRFWQHHPALLYGISAALGGALGLNYLAEAIIIWLFLLIPLLKPALFSCLQMPLRFCIAFTLFLCLGALVHTSYEHKALPSGGIRGSGKIGIHSLVNYEHPFGDQWVYRGTLESFTLEGKSAPTPGIKNVSITVSIPNKDGVTRPLADKAYVVAGTLRQSKSGHYFLKTNTQGAWIPLLQTWSLAEARLKAKELVQRSIQKSYRNLQTQSFLTGIATGNFNDQTLTQDFSRFGLQHIMAISGFHFSIIAGFLSLLFGNIFSRRGALYILAILLTLYFLFLGCSSSILRAWSMSLIALLGALLKRESYGINSLGIALLAVLLNDPLQIQSLGFQFSFATTASILLLYPSIDKGLQIFFKKRTLDQALSMSKRDQYGYIALNIIRQGFALSLAVNAVALPLTLFYFHKFPVMSLVFNLFFPFLVSISIIFLLVGFVISIPFPPLGQILHTLNDIYTQSMLNFTTYTPKAFDIYLKVEEFPTWIPLITLAIVFYGAVIWNHFAKNKAEEASFFI